MTDLKPCPFCGGDENGQELRVVEWMHFWVTCDACLATGPEGKTQDAAKELWNRRPDMESKNE